MSGPVKPDRTNLRPLRPGGPYTGDVAAGAPRIAVVQFPGTNCERETMREVQVYADCPVDLIWHADPFPTEHYVAAILPGGFAHGDHLRAGAIARFSPVMPGIQKFAAAGGLVLGICNGFQVLLEAGLLPGAMLRNASLQFRSEWVWCRVERTDTAFTSACTVGQVLHMPIAHGEGNYVSPVDTDPEGVVLRYCDADGNITMSANPNGSRDNIAGLINAAGNVFGLMPHPERAADSLLGSADGRFLLESLVRSAVPRHPEAAAEGSRVQAGSYVGSFAAPYARFASSG
jgi:phosphoribosylformylglycinamidine synthase subunit PurQ / glutaminase